MIMMRYIDDPHEIPLSNMSPLRLKAIRELLECYFPHMDCRYDIRSEGRIRVKILHVHSICKSLMETSPELNNYYVVIHYDISKGRLVFRIACEDNYLRDHPQGFSKVLFIATRVETEIQDIIKLVSISPTVKRKCRTFFFLRYMDFCGEYKYGDLIVNFGRSSDKSGFGKLCLCEFPYEVLCIPNNDFGVIPSIDNAFENDEQYKQLLQFLIRAPLEECNIASVDLNVVDKFFNSAGGQEYDEELSLEGFLSFTSIDRNQLGLPRYLHDVVELFEKLSPKLRSVFIDSCAMYAKALVSSPNDAVASFVILLENLSKYMYSGAEDESSRNRFQMIYSEFYESLDPYDRSWERFYAVRCAYAHDAILSQNSFERVLNEVIASKDDALFMEKLTFRAMVSWIRRKANES